jgi:DNA-binding transcriptional LysR family regulator
MRSRESADSMDLRQLEMFLSVAMNNSFTLAGQELHVAQSAISRKIKMLEDELGEKLFKRLNKRIHLTIAGEVMLRHTHKIFQDLRNAQMEVSDVAKMKRGVVRIGAGMTACMYLVPQVLEQFNALHPNIETVVVSASTEALLSQIRSNVIDLGVLTLPIVHRDLEVIPFLTEELVLVTSPRHPELSKRRRLHAHEIARYPLILFNRGASTRTLIDRFFERESVVPRVVMESETAAIMKPLVQINLGVSVLPLPAVIPEARRGELHYLRFSEKLSRDIGLVYLKGDYQPKAVMELIELFRATGQPRSSRSTSRGMGLRHEDRSPAGLSEDTPQAH